MSKWLTDTSLEIKVIQRISQNLVVARYTYDKI